MHWLRIATRSIARSCSRTSKVCIPMSATNDAHRRHLVTSRVTVDQIAAAISEVGYKARPLPEVST